MSNRYHLHNSGLLSHGDQGEAILPLSSSDLSLASRDRTSVTSIGLLQRQCPILLALLAVATVIAISLAVPATSFAPSLLQKYDGSSQITRSAMASGSALSSTCPPLVDSLPIPLLLQREIDNPVSVRELVVLIHTGESYYDTRYATVRNTWLSDSFPYDIVAFTTEKPLLDRKVKMVKVTDSVRPGLPPEGRFFMNERVIQGYMHMLYEEPPAKWYFKCDDDTFVHLPNFLALVTQLSSRFPDPLNKPYYFGDCSCWIQDSSWHPCGCPEPCDCTPFYENNVTYACGGAGYFMSRKALEMLIHYEQTVGAHRSGEDMMVGYALLLMNVSCIDSHRQLTLQYNFPLSWRTTDVWRNMISVHKVGPKRMVDLHQRAMGDKWDDVDTQPD
eukprot:TRINITY_DN1035_c0_g1_i3.p1 TRINITY_DN1035_c0_g1~~TRINITY_DN1035_c0_g1_i3.p1  ORF type:complete len:388 (-),score=51.14 TRINITY_DN1035_c0_g1_i3:171-1334(-)